MTVSKHREAPDLQLELYEGSQLLALDKDLLNRCEDSTGNLAPGVGDVDVINSLRNVQVTLRERYFMSTISAQPCDHLQAAV